MPELPEVEIIKQSLTKTIIGKKILEVQKNRPNLRYLIPPNLHYNTVGYHIIDVRRRAKFLLMDLNNNFSLILHLGMTGKILLKEQNTKLDKHDHVIIKLCGNNQLVFNDQRRFGMIDLVESHKLQSSKWLANIGPEPLLREFNYNYLYSTLKNKIAPIKNIIMNNHIIAGVGNIYANESLFTARINPCKLSRNLSNNQIINLVNSIKKTLNKAIKLGGSSLKDFVDTLGKKGDFQDNFSIYGRENQSCIICNNKINKIKLAGRSTFFCNICQQ